MHAVFVCPRRLAGLAPHENRSIPPLRYDWVYRIAAELPHLDISLNGGVESIDDAVKMLSMTYADGEEYLKVDVAPQPSFKDAKAAAKAAAVPKKATTNSKKRSATDASLDDVPVVTPREDGDASAPPETGIAGSFTVPTDSKPAENAKAAACSSTVVPAEAVALAPPISPCIATASDGCAVSSPAAALPPAPVPDEDRSIFGHGLLKSVMIGRHGYHNPWEYRCVACCWRLARHAILLAIQLIQHECAKCLDDPTVFQCIKLLVLYLFYCFGPLGALWLRQL